MKKNSFIEGTIIATLAIVITKIIGMLYVIPFYAIVGVKGAALYAYAYNIYGLFLEISTAGLPNAVGKLVNEYNTLNMQEAKVRTFRLGRKILAFIAIIAFVIMFVFAGTIASLILGDLSGGNTIEEVAFVIRAVSFAILIFPFLSVSRGFFQGHNIISVSSYSQVIEQLARVLVIVLGSYIALKWLKLDLTYAVGIAVFGAFIGGVCAFFYVHRKMVKNKAELHLSDEFAKKDEVSDREIIKKIIKYAIPTIVISLAFSIYNNVDMILVLRTMDSLGFNALDVEFIATGISTWASKISIIITSVGLGLSASLIPHMVESFTLKKYDDVNHKFNKAISLIIFVSIPMCLGISLLSTPIWRVFYGTNNLELGASILSVCIFAPLFTNLYTVSNYTLQSMNRFKLVYISAITGILVNTILDVPLMLLLNVIGLPAYYGATLASIIGFSLTLIIAMVFLKKEYHFEYTEILSALKKVILPLAVMTIVVMLMNTFIKIDYASRFSAIIYIAITSIIGALTYFLISYKMGLVSDVLGPDFLTKLKNRFLKPKETK